MQGDDEAINLGLKWIRSAFFTALLFFVYTSTLLFATWRADPTYTDGLIVGFAEPVLILVFALWMFSKQSRIAAIALLAVFLLGKLVLIKPFLFSDISLETMKFLAPALVPQILWLIIAGYYFINGIRGSFLVQRFNQKGTSGNVI